MYSKLYRESVQNRFQNCLSLSTKLLFLINFANSNQMTGKIENSSAFLNTFLVKLYKKFRIRNPNLSQGRVKTAILFAQSL